MADVSRRFTPHLAAWRAAGGAAGGAAAVVARGVAGRPDLNGSEPWPLAGRGGGGKGGTGGKGGRGRSRARGKGKGKGRGRGKRELKQRQLKRAERAAAGLRHAHEGSGRPLSQLYGTR